MTTASSPCRSVIRDVSPARFACAFVCLEALVSGLGALSSAAVSSLRVVESCQMPEMISIEEANVWADVGHSWPGTLPVSGRCILPGSRLLRPRV